MVNRCESGCGSIAKSRIEEEVYLGDLPIMLGGGEFIINGAERVVVSQLHRSPGVDFVLEQDTTTDRKLPSCRVIPERGSWIEVNVTKKDALTVRIDQSGKFAATTLLRAMDPKFSHRRRSVERVLRNANGQGHQQPNSRPNSTARSPSMT